MAKRAAQARAAGGDATPARRRCATRARRRRRGSRRAASPTRRLQALTWLMKARRLAVRPRPLGPVLRAARQGRPAARPRERPMRVLYCALDQVVPGTTGGSTHVRAVADGLARLGHEVHVLTRQGAGGFPGRRARDGRGRPPLARRCRHSARRPHLRLLKAPAVRAPRAAPVRPDVVIERYHNFGGEGVLAARAVGARAVLEVNAPVIDHPGSAQGAARSRAAAAADATLARARLPSRGPVRHALGARSSRRGCPASASPRSSGAPTPSGSDPGAGGPRAVRTPRRARWSPSSPARSGRGTAPSAWRAPWPSWTPRDRTRVHAVFVGDGPERPRTREAAEHGSRGSTFTGALPYDAMPACLAAADVGVAPFDVAAHPPLQLDFYWSPLKVFEYMASGLPGAWRPASRAWRHWSSDGARAASTPLRDPSGLADALAHCARRRAPPRMGPRRTRARRARLRLATRTARGWTRHCGSCRAGARPR